jgi:aryl-alcohol dehydrogenase-like predicted oxidoreductase
MRTRTMGRLGRDVSEIGFGAWQIGADWGEVDEDAALATLHAAADAGVTFFDTADVYGDGRSERLVGRLRRERAGEPISSPRRWAAGPSRPWRTTPRELPRVERPLAREPRDGHARPRAAALPAHGPLLPPRGLRDLDAMVAEGRMAAYGVSVERVEEALKAIEYPGVASVQIIFNPFRQRPAASSSTRRRAAGSASSSGCRSPPAS